MNQFVADTLRPFLAVGGAATALAGAYVFLPASATDPLAELFLRREYSPIPQPWGALVGLSGIVMICAAFQPTWVFPVLLFGTVEKGVLVSIVLVHGAPAAGSPLGLALALDVNMILYAFLYFGTRLGRVGTRSR